jgi:hypothetical protein
MNANKSLFGMPIIEREDCPEDTIYILNPDYTYPKDKQLNKAIKAINKSGYQGKIIIMPFNSEELVFNKK